MITLAHQDYPELSIKRSCELLGVSRSCYYEQSRPLHEELEDTALREQIEYIMLHCLSVSTAGYGQLRGVSAGLHWP
jgi:hypothetical protein